MKQIFYSYLTSPVGKFLVAGTENQIICSGFTTGHQQRHPESYWIEDEGPIAYATAKLAAYFGGDPVKFDVPLNIVGTEFQKNVWITLQSITIGQTASYGEIAKIIGRPKASRAVGAANRANYLPIFIPCHRIIGSTGKLTGFGGGLDTKSKLLSFEAGFGETPDRQLDLAQGHEVSTTL